MSELIEIKDQNELVACSNYPYAKWEFENFNPVQSRIFEIFQEDANVLVAAKTSAGKTVIAEIFLAHEIRKRGGKGMFLAPLKALAQEKIDQWNDAAYHFGDVNISICTGDYRITEQRQEELKKSNLIIMTSEMLNHRVRNMNSEKSSYLKEIGTLVIDESHLLTVAGRGEHLEVGLMKFTKINPNCRLVLLSATMPNVSQIAEWLAKLNNKKTYILNSEYRPVPLGIHYENYDDEFNSYDQLEKSKIEKAMDIITDYPEDKFLVFVHTKRTGELITQYLRSNNITAEFHNADLDKGKRVDLERRFKNDKTFKVLVATPTLAWGVNTPARRVVIVGVHRGRDEVETYNITQMVGRSGRLGIDPRGDAYVLVPDSKAKFHRDRLNTPQKIVSKLLEKPRNLAFHLVSEIHNESIKNIDDIYHWYERSLASFQSKNLNPTNIKSLVEEMIQRKIVFENDGSLEVSTIGKIASIFYFSPFDVADYSRNFFFLFNEKKDSFDIHIALALAKIDSNKSNIVSSIEKQEMSMFDKKLQKECAAEYMYLTEGIKKAAFCYHNLMLGFHASALAGYQRTLQNDFERVQQVLSILSSSNPKWKDQSYFYELGSRIKYGVASHLISLCKLPNIGKVRAEKLYSLGYKDVASINKLDEKELKKVLNLKIELIQEIKNAALRLSSVS